MIISTQPLFLPLNTANLPTEAVTRDNRLAERIPQPRQVLAPQRARAVASEPEGILEESALFPSELEVFPAADAETAAEAPASSEVQEPAESHEPRADTADERRQQEHEHAQIAVLRARDREVRTHEQAHLSVGGQYAGAPYYELRRGPDGVLYAIGGEVPIDTAPIPGDPAATLAKSNQVQAAALAPRQPSSADRRIAADAGVQAARARQELNEQQAKAREQAAAPQEPAAADTGQRLEHRLKGLGVVDLPEPGLKVDTSA